MTRLRRASVLLTTAALALVVPHWVAVPATAATASVVLGSNSGVVASGVVPAAASAFAVPAKKKRAKATKVIGWKAARKARYPSVALSTLRITGPADRSVKVQKKKKSGRWKTVTTVRTSETKTLDVAFIAQQPGSWRLKVRAVKGYRSKTTSKLRVTTKSWNGEAATSPQADPASTPAGAAAAAALAGVGSAPGAAGARLPVSYDLGGVAGTKLFVSVSGSDSAAGTQSAPLRSVAAAAVSKVSSGGSATVVVRGGTYRRGVGSRSRRGGRFGCGRSRGRFRRLGAQPVSSAWVTEGSVGSGVYPAAGDEWVGDVVLQWAGVERRWCGEVPGSGVGGFAAVASGGGEVVGGGGHVLGGSVKQADLSAWHGCGQGGCGGLEPGCVPDDPGCGQRG